MDTGARCVATWSYRQANTSVPTNKLRLSNFEHYRGLPMRLLAFLVGLLFTTTVYADIANGLPTFDWPQPIVWTDGSTLTAAQITGYQLACTGTAVVNRRISAATGVPPSVTAVANRFAPGPYTCTLALFARKTTTDPEVQGDPSPSVSFSVPPPRPGAPATFSVN